MIERDKLRRRSDKRRHALDQAAPGGPRLQRVGNELGLWVVERQVAGDVCAWVTIRGGTSMHASDAACFPCQAAAQLAAFGLDSGWDAKWYNGVEWQKLLESSRVPF